MTEPDSREQTVLGLPKDFSIYALCNHMNTLTVSWELAYLVPSEWGLIAKLVGEEKGRYWIGYFPDVLPYPYRNVRFVREAEEAEQEVQAYRRGPVLQAIIEAPREAPSEAENIRESETESENRSEEEEGEEEKEEEQKKVEKEDQETEEEEEEEEEEGGEEEEEEEEEEEQEEPGSKCFQHLPKNILYSFFQYCDLSTQFAIAMVSTRFQSIITEIWRQMFTVFPFSENVVSELGETKFWDFCIIVGTHVEAMKFNSVFKVHKEDLESYKSNPQKYLRNKIRYINALFHRYLVHFPLLKTIKVEGSFLNDLTIDALARCCPLLSELKLLDPHNGEITGDTLKMLYNLEVLDLRVCPNLDAKQIEEACEVLQLRELHIVECRKLCNAPTIRHIIAHQYSTLTHLSLTAIEDTNAITLILNIRNLKILKFYWLNDFLEFEKIFYTQLAKIRPKVLRSIRCENEPPFMINQSHLRWGAGKYAKMREIAVLEGRPWLWMKCQKETQPLWSACTSLESFVCLYCRVLPKKQLLILPRLCKSLRSIRFVGCRRQSDESLLKSFQKLRYRNCSFNIESESDWPVTQNLEGEEELKFGDLYRSIECEFKA